MKVPWETGIQVLWVSMLMENGGMVENSRNGGMVGWIGVTGSSVTGR